MLPIFAAREGMIPCQPTPPTMIPGICWMRRGTIRARRASPGSRKPANLTGWKSIQTPVQFVTYPIAAEKSGIVNRLMVSPPMPSPQGTQSGRGRPGGGRVSRRPLVFVA